MITMESRYDKGPRDCQKMAIRRVCHISRFFPYILLLLGQGISFIVPRSLLYRGFLNQGSTALTFICTTIIILRNWL